MHNLSLLAPGYLSKNMKREFTWALVFLEKINLLNLLLNDTPIKFLMIFINHKYRTDYHKFISTKVYEGELVYHNGKHIYDYKDEYIKDMNIFDMISEEAFTNYISLRYQDKYEFIAHGEFLSVKAKTPKPDYLALIPDHLGIEKRKIFKQELEFLETIDIMNILLAGTTNNTIKMDIEYFMNEIENIHGDDYKYFILNKLNDKGINPSKIPIPNYVKIFSVMDKDDFLAYFKWRYENQYNIDLIEKICTYLQVQKRGN